MVLVVVFNLSNSFRHSVSCIASPIGVSIFSAMFSLGKELSVSSRFSLIGNDSDSL